MSRKSSQATAHKAPSGHRVSARGSQRLLTLTATIALLFALATSLASCDTTSTVRFPTLTPTPIPVITEFALPTPQSLPLGITVGPDGALWFTDQSANQVSRITTSGAITGFYIPTSDSRPFGIVTGPDGNLWFAENQGGQIGRITPQGDIIEIRVPTRDSFPIGITAGPDGALWFTEQNGNAIGRLDPARLK